MAEVVEMAKRSKKIIIDYLVNFQPTDLEVHDGIVPFTDYVSLKQIIDRVRFVITGLLEFKFKNGEITEEEYQKFREESYKELGIAKTEVENKGKYYRGKE